MLKLTDYEKDMLNGKMGPFKQRALQKIVEYANVLGAEELCEVTKATVYFGAHPYLEAVESEDYDEIFSKMILCSDRKYRLEPFAEECFSQTCVGPCDHYCYEPLNLSREVFEKNLRYLELTKEAGVSIAGSCTPYLSGWIPIRGEHFVSTESSNILMSNSVLGAYGNADGLEAAAWSAICGRTPKWGNHIAENRYATHIFEIQCKSESILDWDIIGLTLGRLLPGNGRPVLTGNFKRPNLNKLKRCFASLATTSGAEICHIVGCTVEAPTLEAALAGHEPLGKFVITQRDCDESLALVCDPGGGSLEMVVLGCPHYSLEEIRYAAKCLEGRHVHEGVSLQIWTDMAIQQLAKVNGYADIIERAGGHLLNSACPMVCGRTVFDRVKTGFATDGAKQAHYLHTDLNVKIFYGDAQKCIEAAVRGAWEA
ncbi:MAG: aconitase X catalytic domain-containing protein [Synergistaceae bacterium]|jgi:predicted aconitase|nr:aconitase X catalytic domain-containing protein [Synergistaceae bacterium]